jgi:inhibitor of KinA
LLWPERLQLEPLGDQAVLATFPDEAAAARFAAALREQPPAWVLDVVLSYVTVAVFYRWEDVTYDEAVAELRQVRVSRTTSSGRVHVIPCCYELHEDLPRIAEFTKLSTEEIIRLHLSVEYTVYAIGFCPGFPYLGYLPEPLRGVPRLEQPRVRVEPGSVGITGKQTGIYPLPTPGGWNLIGRTPLELVDVENEYFPIRAGDRVRFTRIDEAEFQRLRGQRLSEPEG